MSGKAVTLSDSLMVGWEMPPRSCKKKRDGPEGPPRSGPNATLRMQALLEVCYDNGKGTLMVMSLPIQILR